MDRREGELVGWAIEQISAWQHRLPWICGFNYLPRTAVNWDGDVTTRESQYVTDAAPRRGGCRKP